MADVSLKIRNSWTRARTGPRGTYRSKKSRDEKMHTARSSRQGGCVPDWSGKIQSSKGQFRKSKHRRCRAELMLELESASTPSSHLSLCLEHTHGSSSLTLLNDPCVCRRSCCRGVVRAQRPYCSLRFPLRQIMASSILPPSLTFGSGPTGHIWYASSDLLPSTS